MNRMLQVLISLAVCALLAFAAYGGEKTKGWTPDEHVGACPASGHLFAARPDGGTIYFVLLKGGRIGECTLARYRTDAGSGER